LTQLKLPIVFVTFVQFPHAPPMPEHLPLSQMSGGAQSVLAPQGLPPEQSGEHKGGMQVPSGPHRSEAH
jgi:hypothetical protein